MIPKLICWLLGHVFYTDVFTGSYGMNWYPLEGKNVQVPIVRPSRNEACPRCGASLKGEQQIRKAVEEERNPG